MYKVGPSLRYGSPLARTRSRATIVLVAPVSGVAACEKDRPVLSWRHVTSRLGVGMPAPWACLTPAEGSSLPVRIVRTWCCLGEPLRPLGTGDGDEERCLLKLFFPDHAVGRWPFAQVNAVCLGVLHLSHLAVEAWGHSARRWSRLPQHEHLPSIELPEASTDQDFPCPFAGLLSGDRPRL